VIFGRCCRVQFIGLTLTFRARSLSLRIISVAAIFMSNMFFILKEQIL
jgi:hypothetical protein